MAAKTARTRGIDTVMGPLFSIGGPAVPATGSLPGNGPLISIKPGGAARGKPADRNRGPLAASGVGDREAPKRRNAAMRRARILL